MLKIYSNQQLWAPIGIHTAMPYHTQYCLPTKGEAHTNTQTHKRTRTSIPIVLYITCTNKKKYIIWIYSYVLPSFTYVFLGIYKCVSELKMYENEYKSCFLLTQKMLKQIILILAKFHLDYMKDSSG